MERIVAGVSGPATMVLLSGCGHAPFRDREDEVVARIVDFLGELHQAA